MITDEELNSMKKQFVRGDLKEDFELVGVGEQQKINKRKAIERGLSSSYVRKCHEAYSQDLISRKRLAEMLLTDDFELPKILSLFNLK
jgi:hypothetical protein